MTDFLIWLHGTPLGVTSRESQWLFAIWETLHFIGLSVLIGAMLLVDLRLLGLLKVGAPRSTLVYTRVAIIGFLIVLISGIGLFSATPAQYWGIPLFRLKMGLVFLGGVNALYFEILERRKVVALADGADTGPAIKLIAGISLLLWFNVICVGRFLPVAGGN